MKRYWIIATLIITVSIFINWEYRPVSAKAGISGWGMKSQVRDAAREHNAKQDYDLIPMDCYQRKTICRY